MGQQSGMFTPPSQTDSECTMGLLLYYIIININVFKSPFTWRLFIITNRLLRRTEIYGRFNTVVLVALYCPLVVMKCR